MHLPITYSAARDRGGFPVPPRMRVPAADRLRSTIFRLVFTAASPRKEIYRRHVAVNAETDQVFRLSLAEVPTGALPIAGAARYR